jgi:hypothetical protein
LGELQSAAPASAPSSPSASSFGLEHIPECISFGRAAVGRVGERAFFALGFELIP